MKGASFHIATCFDTQWAKKLVHPESMATKIMVWLNLNSDALQFVLWFLYFTIS